MNISRGLTLGLLNFSFAYGHLSMASTDLTAGYKPSFNYTLAHIADTEIIKNIFLSSIESMSADSSCKTDDGDAYVPQYYAGTFDHLSDEVKYNKTLKIYTNNSYLALVSPYYVVTYSDVPGEAHRVAFMTNAQKNEITAIRSDKIFAKESFEGAPTQTYVKFLKQNEFTCRSNH